VAPPIDKTAKTLVCCKGYLVL